MYALSAARALLAHTDTGCEADRHRGAEHRRRHLHLHQPQHRGRGALSARGHRAAQARHGPTTASPFRYRQYRARPSPRPRPRRGATALRIPMPIRPTPSATMTPREIVRNSTATSSASTPPSAPWPSRCATAGGACSSTPELRNEVMPKNILMIGPTGVGKTEIARRLATLANAPFVKVEATRFTEVGYVGKDVEQIIRDLADTAVKLYREPGQAARAHAGRGARRGPHPRCAAAAARNRARLRLRRGADHDHRHRRGAVGAGIRRPAQKLRKQLRAGELDDARDRTRPQR